MIDWLTFHFPCEAAAASPNLAGLFLVMNSGGDIEKQVPRRAQVEGSHSAQVQAWVWGEDLWISGNPSKFFQGHNLFGSDDVPGLVYAMAESITQSLGTPLTDMERVAIKAGHAMLTRVDCTGMYRLPSRADARAMSRAAAQRARTRHGRTAADMGTVYFGLGSRRWMLKMYAKGDELESKKKGHSLPAKIAHRSDLIEYADTCIRIELELKRMELVSRGLDEALHWKGETAMEQLAFAIGAVQMPELVELPSDVLAQLPGRLVAVYRAWQAGDDIRAIYSRPTFYRYRAELLELGVDITCPVPHEEQPSNVVPFRRVIEVTLAGVPDWARGTELYYEPRVAIA